MPIRDDLPEGVHHESESDVCMAGRIGGLVAGGRRFGGEY